MTLDKWQTIDSAPRKGTRIIARLDFQDDNEIEIKVIYYSTRYNKLFPWRVCWEDTHSAVSEDIPTHWRTDSDDILSLPPEVDDEE